MQQQRNLPFALVTLIFGVLSVPLAFAVHLVSLAVVLAVLALALGGWGRWRLSLDPQGYTSSSLRRSRLGFRLGAVGLLCSVAMWILWATNVLL